MDEYSQDSSIYSVVETGDLGDNDENERNALNKEHHDKMLWSTKPQLGSNNCIYQSLLDCGYNFPAMKECVNIEKLVIFLKHNNLPINIMYNIPDYKDELETNPTDYCRAKIKGHNYPLLFEKMREYKRNWMFECEEEAEHTLIYDAVCKHIEKAIDVKPKLKINVFFRHETIILHFSENNNIVVKKHVVIKPPKKRPLDDSNTKFVFFDLECIIDEGEDCNSLPYSVSFAVLDIIDLQKLEDLENNNNDNDRDEFIGRKLKNYMGFDCMNKFLSDVEEIVILDRSSGEIDMHYIFTSFNGAKYDNFMLLSALSRFRPNVADVERHTISHVEYHGNTISNIWFFDNTCTTFDLRRHLTVGNLFKLCKDFKIQYFCKKKDLISFFEIQSLYYYDKDDFINNLCRKVGEDVLKSYNNYDILSLALLFFRYKNMMYSFDTIKEAHSLNEKLHSVYMQVSLPSYLYKICKVFMKKNNVYFPSLTYDQFLFVKRGSIAARIQHFPFNHDGLIEEKIMSLDVTSMYPYVMFVSDQVNYPCGEIRDDIQTAAWIINTNNILHTGDRAQLPFKGFYTVNINQQHLIDNGKPVYIPFHTKEGNEWDSTVAIKQNDIVLCCTDIVNLVSYGCEVEFVLGGRCIWFTKTVNNFKVFGWLAEFMKKKNLEDEYLARGDDRYNNTSRYLCKLIPNSMSGKFNEGVHEDTSIILNKHMYNSHILNKEIDEKTVEICGHLDMDTFIVSYKKNFEKIDQRNQFKPIYAGIEIYAKSRDFVYENLIYPLGNKCLYTDTDAVKFKASDFHIVEQILRTTVVPHNRIIEDFDGRYRSMCLYDPEGGKIFGGFVDESLVGNNKTYINNKKEYAQFVFDEDNNIKDYCFSCKGVQEGSILLNMDMEGLSEFIMNGRVTNQVAAHEFAKRIGNEGTLRNKDNILKMFDGLHLGESQYTLNNFFIRDIKKSQVRNIYVLKTLNK
jgi:hypothetical protein